MAQDFDLLETTIADIHAAFRAGRLTARALLDMYLARIAAYDQAGPCLNAIISLNPSARDDADRLDAAFKTSGFVGPLHGIPLVMKDQGDVKGTATTMGSVLFKDHFPDRDAFVVARLRAAGAIFIAKTTLGELGAGDTHGSLFGSTRNVYDLARTAGGSSGGSGVAASANFCTAAIGQEGFASIRRPSTWNGIAGMRPTAGLVSRTGVYGGWPALNGSLGPMARSVADLARLLDAMVGYDPDDPVTALGATHAHAGFADALDPGALNGARVGILRESIGYASNPDSDDFKQIDTVFDHAVAELHTAGAELVDPITIPDLKSLMAARSRSDADEHAAFAHYVAGSAAPPFATRADAMSSKLFAETSRGAQARWAATNSDESYFAHLRARDTLMVRLHHVMAEHRLDAIVHKAVEHGPTLISEGLNPPFRDQTGAIHINTFLMFVPSVVVPAGFTRERAAGGDHVSRPSVRGCRHAAPRLRLRMRHAPSHPADVCAVGIAANRYNVGSSAIDGLGTN